MLELATFQYVYIVMIYKAFIFWNYSFVPDQKCMFSIALLEIAQPRTYIKLHWCLVWMPRRQYDRNHHYQVFFCTEQWGNWEFWGRSLHYYRHYYHQYNLDCCLVFGMFWRISAAWWKNFWMRFPIFMHLK